MENHVQTAQDAQMTRRGLSQPTPPSVRKAVSLMWWAFGAQALLTAFMIFTEFGVAFVICMGIMGLLPWAIARGSNVARIGQRVLLVTFLVLYGIALWNKGVFSLTGEKVFDFAADAIRFGLHATAAVLLASKDTTSWFQQIRASKQVRAV
jgi:hypothetical protein